VSVNKPSDAFNAGMANRQRDVDLRFTQSPPSVRTLAWLGLNDYVVEVRIRRKTVSVVGYRQVKD
jgi:hypothetical protein